MPCRLYVGADALNSSSHACAAQTLSAEPADCPECCFWEHGIPSLLEVPQVLHEFKAAPLRGRYTLLKAV